MTDAADRLSAALADRYQLERELGQGGMATVYLAEDLKHHRQVAIKVLRPELAAVLGAERFVQEIATTAALQHPNILPLFDSGEADGSLYYVMPYVEGETLRSKLDRESQLGIDEAVKITSEVGDALDYAHVHGVVHRDIKPENILLHAGRPMVADFGIALAVSAAAGGRMTETGLSLGTPHYMSPEQATAEKTITGRSDIYSLGAVLYEMLTGEPPHTGKTAQQIIAKIVTDTPRPVTEIRKSVPPNIAAALREALEKLPADRFESAKAFGAALADPHFATATDGASAPSNATQMRTLGSWMRSPWSWGALGTVVLVSMLALWGWLRPRPALPLIRYRLELPADAEFGGSIGPVPAPDGSFLVYTGPNAAGDDDRLWIKRRDDDRPTPIAGTDGAVSFAISPDGSSIAFTGPAAGMLQRVPVHGGAPVTIADGGVAPLAGLTWLDTNTLVVPNIDVNSLETIPVTGGTPTVVYHTDSARVFQPVALPDGRGLLFGRCFAYCAVAELWALDLGTGKAHRVLSGVTGSSAYVAPGFVLYSSPAGGLFAMAFDVDDLEVHGEPIAIADSVPAYFSIGAEPFHVSRSGTLIMEFGSPPGQRRYDMVWVDAHGRVTPVDTTWTFELTNTAGNRGWALSPDGRQLAVGLHTASGDGIWVKQLPDGPLHKVTADSAPAYRPHWTTDGRYVTFVGGNRSPGFFMHRADGVGDDSVLARGFLDEGVIVPGGKWYVLRTGHVGPGVGGRHMLAFHPGIDSAPVPLISAGKAHDVEAAAVSPNGRWIAYNSNESGQLQVYIRPFPDVNAAKWQVSRSGGVAPLWSRDGGRLFYLRADGTMMTVRVTPRASPPLGDPVPMFALPAGVDAPNGNYTPWDVAPDGRFIMARMVTAHQIVPPAIVVVENWLHNWERSVGK